MQWLKSGGARPKNCGCRCCSSEKGRSVPLQEKQRRGSVVGGGKKNRERVDHTEKKVWETKGRECSVESTMPGQDRLLGKTELSDSAKEKLSARDCQKRRGGRRSCPDCPKPRRGRHDRAAKMPPPEQGRPGIGSRFLRGKKKAATLGSRKGTLGLGEGSDSPRQKKARGKRSTYRLLV